MSSFQLTENQSRVARYLLLAGLAVLLLGLIIPTPIRALIEIAVLAAGVVASAATLQRGRPLQLARIGFLLLAGLYLLLLLSSNLPDLRTGLEGIRYTLVAIAGLFVGLALPDREGTPRMIPAVTGLLLIGATVSLAVHLIDPEFEHSLKRSAGIATGQLGGQIRMQGLLSGPFHIAMLGSFLTLAGVWRLIRRDLWGVPLLVIGETVLLLARVRTGLIVTLLGLVLLAVLAYRLKDVDQSTLGGWKNRILPVLAIPLLLIAVGVGSSFVESSGSASLMTEAGSSGSSGNAAISELGSLPVDHRTGSRITAMRAAFNSTMDSPIVGWGPGSAASGVQNDFLDAGKVHEQPHNGPLGIAVESGIVGLAFFLLTVGSVGVNLIRELWMRRRPAEAGIALAAAFSLAFFFLTSDALGALPISLCMALITGLYLANLSAPDTKSGQ